MHGCTTVLYEGKPVGTPDAGAFWRVVSEYRVKALFTAPTAFRAIKQADPTAKFPKKYDLSCLESLFLAGEHSDPETIHWCERALPNIPPPVDHWWQTELGWPAVGNAVGLGRVPVRYGSCALPVPGFELAIFDDDGNTVPPKQLGNLAIKTPLPPGTLTTIYNDEDRYLQEYLTKYPGYYETGDAAYIDDDGYVYIMGRTDDVINTAGHRLSTGAMEEILMEHPTVADCAVIAVNDEIKGQVPVGLVVCVTGTKEEEYERIRDELVGLVREEMGPIASFKKVGIVKGLPKTRSGKTLRGTMSKIANNEPYKITPTIEDATIFEHLEPAIKNLIEN
jgi:propionyl-CoA synthetase